jgi:hypothetical protein
LCFAQEFDAISCCVALLGFLQSLLFVTCVCSSVAVGRSCKSKDQSWSLLANDFAIFCQGFCLKNSFEN